MNKPKPIGYKIIVTTEESLETIEEALDSVLRDLSMRARMDLIIKMTDEEVEKEFKLDDTR